MNYEARMQGGDETLGLPGPGGDGASSRQKWAVIGGILAAILVIGVVAKLALGSGDDTKKATPQIPTVTVAIPGRQTVERLVTGTGSLAARREMPVGVAGEGGVVVRVLVEPGDWVGAGQVLATVDRSVQVQTAASLAAQVRVARADAQLAQNELERARALVGRGFVSKSTVDQRIATRDAAVARVRVAEASLSETRARNARLDIRSPAAGLVLTRGVEPGQIISSGSDTLFRVAMGGQMELRVQLSEADLQSLRPGARAQVTPVGVAQQFAGEVWQVAPVIDPQTRQGIARIALSYDPALRPGGFASARISAGSTVAPLLPQTAVQSDTSGTFVYILNAQDQAVRRPVTTGALSDQGIVIERGLVGNERVVLTAGAFLNAGQKVIPNQVAVKQ